MNPQALGAGRPEPSGTQADCIFFGARTAASTITNPTNPTNQSSDQAIKKTE